jgi:hypothetical protein
MLCVKSEFQKGEKKVQTRHKCFCVGMHVRLFAVEKVFWECTYASWVLGKSKRRKSLGMILGIRKIYYGIKENESIMV